MLLSQNSFADSLLSVAKSPEDLRGALMLSPARHPQMPIRFWLALHKQLECERSIEDRVIDLACAYFDIAARNQFLADGSKDGGECGGMMLGYRGNTKFARALLERRDENGARIAYKSGGRVYICKSLPSGVVTQHRKVQEKAHDAFAEVAAEAGYNPAEHRSYLD